MAVLNRNVTTTVSEAKGGDVTTTRKGGGGITVGETKIDAASLKAIRKLFAEAQKMYAPGGAFTAGTEAQLARGRTRSIAGGMQGLAAAGLATTSMAGGLARKYEEEVAAPAMAQAESARMSAMTGLMTAQAGTEAQLAPRFTKQTTTPTPETTQQVTTPRTTTQRTTSPAIFTGGGGYSGGSATPGFPTTSVRRPAARPTATQPRPQQQKPAATVRPTLSMPALPDPPGTWQATIGGTSFYSGGDGGFTRKEAPPLSSFYSDFQKTTPKKVSGPAGTPSLASIYSGNLY